VTIDLIALPNLIDGRESTPGANRFSERLILGIDQSIEPSAS
jgi:hypothetical protein